MMHNSQQRDIQTLLEITWHRPQNVPNVIAAVHQHSSEFIQCMHEFNKDYFNSITHIYIELFFYTQTVQ